MADSRINIIIQANDKATNSLKDASKSVDELGKSSDDAARKTNAFGISTESAFRVARTAALAGGAAFVAAAGFAVTSAADYEQSLNVFKSVSGATASQMTQVSATARQLGQDVALPGISAKDAAFAMVELSKAGLDVNDTLRASKGVLSLAKAGQLETAEAAGIAANALNAFNLEGDQASRVADLLAAGANASSADVRDMAFSLQMSAAQAAAVKVPVEDLTTAIALMANNGVKGSDAGTSLKTMFMNLIPTTDRAKESMAALHLDFYNAQGQFVGMRAAVEQLQKGTKGLTDEQKALHIENIFGADSSRAVNILLKEGVAGYDKLRASVTKSGAAVELAAAQNAGFKGALDNVRSSVETVAIDVGTRLLPHLTNLIQTVGPGLTSALSTAGMGLANFADAFPAIWTNMTTVTGILPGLAAGFLAYQLIVNASTVATAALAVAQGALNAVMMLNPFALVAAAAVGIVTAYGMVVSNSDNASNSSERLRLANEALTNATNNNKAAQDRLSGALLTQEGASLAVERAQRSYTDAVAQYGPKSLEAREADLNLRRARQDLANATTTVRDRTNEAKTAADNLATAKANAVAANNAMRDSAYGAANGFQAMANAATAASKAAQSGNSGKAAQIQADAFKVPVAGKHSAGTAYTTGGMTLVGEAGPEIIEMPPGARVNNHYESKQMMAEGVGGGGISIVFQGPVSMNSDQDVASLADRIMSMIDQKQRMNRFGAAA